jgi:23S rRNA (uracil1939-C5)-methyltransferase
MTVLAAEPWGYRNRIRLAFDAEGHPGYRGRRSHDVVPLAECPIAAPLLVRAALASGELAHALPPHYRPSEISLFCNADETELLVGVTVAAGNKALWEEFAQSFVEKIPETKGIEFASESAPGELPRQLTHWGAGSLVYRVAPFDYRVDQGAFFQVNRWLVEQLAECVTAGQSGAVAWDLFAGVGLFARRLAEQFAHVIAVESAPAAEAALQHNLRETNPEAVSATRVPI